MAQSFGPTWMRPKDSTPVNNQSRNHDILSNPTVEGEAPSRQFTVTPTLSLADSFNTGSSPITPTILDGLSSSQRATGHLNNAGVLKQQKDAEILPNERGSYYSMQQMFDVLSDMKSKNQIVINNELSDDPQDASYRISDGINNLAHLEANQPNEPKGNGDLVGQVPPDELSRDLGNLNIQQQTAAPESRFLDRSNSGWAAPVHTLRDPLLNPLLNPSNNDLNLFSTPPGLQQLPQLLNPDQISWVYLDPMGNAQGPFSGLMMQLWLEKSFLAVDLKLKRVEEHQYQTLGEFMSFVGNFQTPFLVPLPDLSLHHQLHQTHASAYPSLAINTQSQALLPQRVASPWLQQPSPASDFFNGTQSPFSTSVTMVNDSNSFGSSARFMNPAQPFIGGQQPQQLQQQQPQQHQQPIPQQLQQPQAVDGLFDQLQSTVVDTVLQEPHFDDHKLVKSFIETQREDELKQEEQNEIEIPEKPDVVPEPALRVEPSVEQPTEPIQETPPTIKKQPLKPKLAPWASSTSVSQTKPKLSLLEIQEMETQERLKQEEKEREIERQQNLVATQILLNSKGSVTSSPIVEEKPLLPKTASWASTKTNVPVVPKKTLADIQREEAEADLALKEEDTKRSQTLAAKLAEATSFANLISQSNGNAWTVITKKPVAKPVVKSSVSGMVSTSSKPTNPSVLRSVSASSYPVTPKLAPIISTSTTKQGNSRDEFFGWVRQQLSQLNNGVNREDVLSILIQLPASSESQEIIADTIYSNSSVMDGRRFALEFCKRKQTIEKSIPNGIEFNWIDELYRTLNSNPDTISTSTTSGDNWDDAFKVVTKKNKKKVNREF